MTTTDDHRPSPIYDGLIDEHGDVLAETREVAQQALQEASAALDWSELHSAHRLPQRSARAA
ncbi:hypothetical protein LHJ74_01625 [Streptomyces sp. N2-109]|uniref:Uncharacterized protein n=1 Tax=Streptomyces gossypii TaxID=2883101 RepID=A0ABT2JL97_9ACTN|nr:hypothetical protein [Streptomyces gossypii]MCT2588652.1 hypothetical protein [Streptomyces gossypii]